MRKVCFFLGQRSPCGTQLPGLAAELTRHIEGYGVRDFVVGRYGAGARLAAEAVVMEKKRFPEIRLLRLRPYPLHGAACIPKGADGVIAPPGFADLPVALALARADLYMLRHSSFLIAYAPQPELHVQEVLAFARQMQAHGLLHLTELHSPR